MGDLLSDGADWLGDTFASHVSQSITYTRSSSSVTISATPGETEMSVVDVSGFTVDFHAVDFTFRASDLDFGSGVVEPEEGDTIELSGRTYEVLSVPGGRHFRYSDPYRTILRVHTKLIDT